MVKDSGLSPAQEERLDWFIEECAEGIQAASKIKRHGYTSNHPDYKYTDNRADLQKEISQIFTAVHRLQVSGDIDMELDKAWVHAVDIYKSKKMWFHYQEDEIGAP